MVAYLLGCFGLSGNKPFQPDTPPFSIQPYTTFEHSSGGGNVVCAKIQSRDIDYEQIFDAGGSKPGSWLFVAE
jgi:hypothetical protein